MRTLAFLNANMKHPYAYIFKTPLLLVVLLGLLNLYLGGVYQFEEPMRWANIFSSDSEGYYLYLPATFIYGYIDVPVTYIHEVVTSPILFKYTYGVAFLEAPFFALAHVAAPLFGYPANGFSEPYAFAVLLSTTFYGGLGLYLTGLLLQKRFGWQTAWITIAALYLGTNLLYYMMKDPGMSHPYSFFLFALLLYLLERLQPHPKRLHFLLVGLVYGLICVIRPTNAVVGLVFLCWNTGISAKALKQRLGLALTYRKQLLLGLAGIVLAILPQLLYWHYASGNWLVYSYGNEGFHNWHAPKMLSVLFSVQNGWLVYSPMMVFTLWGLGLMLYKKALNGLFIAVLLLIATYTFGSWWAWWFGGAYGHRCFIDFLPFLAFPFAYWVQWLRQQSWTLQLPVLAIALLFCYYNAGMTYWYNYTAPWDGENWNWQSWWNIAGRLFSIT
jgi:hypothetical protein